MLKLSMPSICLFAVCFTMPYNVLQLQEFGEFKVQNCLLALILKRSIKLHWTT